jgi:putative ATP-binding cassette transporter
MHCKEMYPRQIRHLPNKLLLEKLTIRIKGVYMCSLIEAFVSSHTFNTASFPLNRITEDVRTFTAFSLQLFITVVTSIIDLVSFSLILYSIQPQLFATIIGYAAFGTVATTYIGSSLLPLNFAKLRKEADL